MTKLPSRRRSKRERASLRGSTLMEMLLASTLLGAVVISFGTIYGVASHHLVQETNAFLDQNDASFAMEHMKRHLMIATQIKPTVNPVDTVSRGMVEFFSDPPDPDGSGPLPDNEPAGWRRYQVVDVVDHNVVDHHLVYYPRWPLDTNDPKQEVICRKVVNLEPFQHPLASEIEITLQTQRGGGGTTLETTVNLRGVPVNSP